MEIEKQRCFTIPRSKLDLVLTALFVNFTTDLFKPSADYIFKHDSKYDVVISYRGSYLYMENELEKFMHSISES